MCHRPVTRSQIALNPTLLLPPLVNVHSTASSSSQSLNVFPAVTLTAMAHVSLRNHVTWNNGGPLIPPTPPVVWEPILATAMKIVPKFIGECHMTPREHLKDIASVCIIHGITEKHVALIFLVASFKGRALDWFRSLGPNTIVDWDQLGDRFFQRFSDKADRSSLMH